MNNENKNSLGNNSEQTSAKRKKVMYVPDEEVLAYSRAKNVENETKAETIINDEKSNENKPKRKNKFLTILEKILPYKGDRPLSIAIKCIAIVAAIGLIVSGTYLYIYFSDISYQNGKIDNVRNTYDLNRDDYSKNEDDQFSKFDVLKQQNSDIIGWITIKNTEVDNPVYQTTDNQFYVDHDMDKKYNSYGALFLDYRCDIDPKSLTQNQIIYGHHMRYGAMFGTLPKFRDLEFYKKSPTISFDSLYEQRVYKIFAVMVVNDAEDETFGYSYTAYRTVFTSDTDFLDWIKHSRERSLIDTTVDVTVNDEIITLSTCCYDYDNARLVVLARLVRPGESTEVNTADAVKNTDVIYSKEYYKKKGLKIPVVSSQSSTSSEKKD